MAVKHYSDLIAWQKAMDLVIQVYGISDAFPRSEVFGLTNQIRRAAVSIPSNIAEGQGRGTTQDFTRFLCIAKGSLQEVETQVLLSNRLKYISDETKFLAMETTTEISKVLNGLIRSLST